MIGNVKIRWFHATTCRIYTARQALSPGPMEPRPVLSNSIGQRRSIAGNPHNFAIQYESALKFGLNNRYPGLVKIRVPILFAAIPHQRMHAFCNGRFYPPGSTDYPGRSPSVGPRRDHSHEMVWENPSVAAAIRNSGNPREWQSGFRVNSIDPGTRTCR